MMSALPSLAISSLMAGVSALEGIVATVPRWAGMGRDSDPPPATRSGRRGRDSDPPPATRSGRRGRDSGTPPATATSGLAGAPVPSKRQRPDLVSKVHVVRTAGRKAATPPEGRNLA